MFAFSNSHNNSDWAALSRAQVLTDHRDPRHPASPLGIPLYKSISCTPPNISVKVPLLSPSPLSCSRPATLALTHERLRILFLLSPPHISETNEPRVYKSPFKFWTINLACPSIFAAGYDVW